MAIRRVLIDGDELLRKKSKPVTVFDNNLAVLLDDMFETMHKNEGAGLAGVQIGVLKRLFVMKAGKEAYECINPEIIEESTRKNTEIEGCLSIPNKCGLVERPYKISVKFQDRTGKTINKTFTGFEAKCFCHESDHLDGILYSDKASKMFKDRKEYANYEEKKGGKK